MTIDATVGLPVYDSGFIAWLSFESLCRQETDINWELVVCEERHGAAYNQLISDNEQRLADAGCVSVSYIPLDRWIPLTEKYIIMRNNAHSDVFVMQAADCYSHSLRVQNAYDALHDGRADWFQSKRGVFYEVFTGKLILFDRNLLKIQHPCGPDMSWRTSLMRHLRSEYKRSGVDKWLFDTMERGERRKLASLWEDKDQELKSLNTHGLNKISVNRSGFFKKPSPPFMDLPGWELSDIVPEDVAEKLQRMYLL